MAMKINIQKLSRVVFYLLYYSFARYLPISYRPYAFGSKKIRYWICRHFLAECGKNVNIEYGADIGTGRHLQIGDNSGIGVNCRVAKAVIGKNVMMGPDVVFIGSNHNHRFDDLSRPMCQSGKVESGPVVVGDNVWIGTRVIILPGCKVGDGAVVGAGAVVTKDVPDYAVVAGNPAKVIKLRKEL